MNETSGLVRSPSSDSEQPNRIDTSSTCRMSPFTKPLTNVSGISLRKNVATPVDSTCLAVVMYEAMAAGSSVFGSTFMPWPGPNR